MSAAPNHQQPIFHQKPAVAAAMGNAPLPRRADREISEPAFERRVLPQCIYAPGKDRFEVIVRGAKDAVQAKTLIYNEVPLAAAGWTWEGTKVRHLRNKAIGMVFLVERI